jgi:flagellin-like hook-associated protein FlgL
VRNNPFGDDEQAGVARPNPFGDDEQEVSTEQAATQIEQAARKIRGLRSQLGAEGLTIPATRELIDETARALEAAARALRGLDRNG